MGLAEQSSLPCLWLPLFFQLSPDGSGLFLWLFQYPGPFQKLNSPALSFASEFKRVFPKPLQE